MRTDTWEKLGSLLIGLGVGGVAALLLVEYRNVLEDPVTCAEKSYEHESYRLCMQSMGSLGCKMEVEDFARYRELERQLEECADDD